MNRNVPLVILLAYALVVGGLSLQPGGNSAIGSYDKLAHFLTYAVFAVLAYRLGLARITFLFCGVAIVAYSGLLELGQSYVPGRMMSGLDLIANAAGVVLGSVLCLVFFDSKKFTVNSDSEGKARD